MSRTLQLEEEEDENEEEKVKKEEEKQEEREKEEEEKEGEKPEGEIPVQRKKIGQWSPTANISDGRWLGSLCV